MLELEFRSLVPGEKAGLSITIEEYKPHVVCQEKMSKYQDVRECQELLSMMPASEDIQVFGKKGDRGVDVGLPFDLAGRTSSALSLWAPRSKGS